MGNGGWSRKDGAHEVRDLVTKPGSHLIASLSSGEILEAFAGRHECGKVILKTTEVGLDDIGTAKDHLSPSESCLKKAEVGKVRQLTKHDHMTEEVDLMSRIRHATKGVIDV